MIDRTKIDVEDFREWAMTAEDEDLEDFIEDIKDIILDLEQDDYFGTEGLNKRFG